MVIDMGSEEVKKSPYSVPYHHQTWNHLFFDRLRAVQLEIRFMQSYLQEEESGRIGGAGLSSEIAALSKCGDILFTDVYQSIRGKWL